MRSIMLAAAIALAMGSAAAFAQPAPTASATAGGYSTSTTQIGTLLDDPAAKAVLAKYLPDLTASDQIDMARGMTLKDIQQYAPDKVSDKALASIDADLAALPAKK